ncbi:MULTISPECIES: hypothetical protein [unclassified Methylobacterium]|jgi:hypothetical protein|uniref:hypothetical protein n=1 Tax=unclassified Methylobacterium TaxID=2615210 RepID=UPI0013556CB6|nr:hypothetical protein [Methylobacterium sp. 2A]MWV25995.1 hypothetical protein [Methylobacterium sp. 2A]
MTTRLRLALFCALVSLPAAAHAQAALRLEGTCEKLVIGTQDLSAACSPVLTNAVSRNRTRFDFTTSDGQSLSFSGNGAQQEATEETDPLQPINVVTLGQDAAPTLAIGACRFSTPEPGRTAITCEARAADGRAFAGTFVTAAKAAAGAPAAPPAR